MLQEQNTGLSQDFSNQYFVYLFLLKTLNRLGWLVNFRVSLGSYRFYSLTIGYDYSLLVYQECI